MVGRIAIEEVSGKFDLVANWAADKFAQPSSGCAATNVEAGQFDCGVGGSVRPFERLAKRPPGECILSDDQRSRLLDRPRDPLAPRGFADADNSGIGLELHHVPQKVRPVAAPDIEE